MLIEFIPSLACDKGNIEYNQFLINNNSKSQYQLIATINRPSPIHFNCAIYEPRKKNLTEESFMKGWFIHDGLQNGGKLYQITNLKEIWKQNPFILFYKKN